MSKHLKIFKVFLKIHLQVAMAYRLGSLMWIINGAISPMLSMLVWLTISGSNALVLNQSQIANYFFFSLLIHRLTQIWSLEQVGEWIKDGGISSVLVKPQNYMVENLARQLGSKAARLFSLFPVMLVIGFLLRQHLSLPIDPWRYVLTVIAIISGFCMIFMFENTLALLIFWMDDIRGLSRVNDILNGIFSGSIIPIVFMPVILKSIMTFYPARFTVSFPLEILLGTSSYLDIGRGFIICASWLLILLFLYKFLFTRGIRKYSAIGG